MPTPPPAALDKGQIIPPLFPRLRNGATGETSDLASAEPDPGMPLLNIRWAAWVKPGLKPC